VIGPNELTRELVSEQCIKSLIAEMLKGGNPLTVGVGIVIEVIRKNNSDYDLDNQTGPIPKSTDPIYLGTLLRQFANNIPSFMELVNNANHKVVNNDGSVTTRRRELKAAFGENIEPLGFDRFKTCELMAELLHCSNMALLNERGAEADVKKRDVERERLKAEGKLQSARPENDFGTSVDSHGFHHARAPSSESPEEIRKLEVQNNADEEEFEKVAASEALPEDIQAEFDEKVRELESAVKTPGSSSDPTKHITPPTTPAADTSGQSTPTATSQQPLEEGESPTASGLSATVGGLKLEDKDKPSSEQQSPLISTGDSTTTTNQTTSLLTKQLNEFTEGNDPEMTLDSPPHNEDRPAPLFSRQHGQSQSEQGMTVNTKPADSRSGESENEVTPIEDASETRSVVLGQDFATSQYEVDIDGSPVVGDLLKMMFVENKVVPTILVGCYVYHVAEKDADTLIGFLFPLPME
jgi:SIT4-associating protein SAP185/190